MLVPSCRMMHIARPVVVLLCFLLLANGETPPKFTRTPDDQTGVSGGVASFVCQAMGDPRPKIVWNKKGKKVSNQRFEVIEFDDGSGSVLRIQPLRTPRDEAIYECVASNSVGETSSSTRLTVLREDQLPSGFPTIDMGPQLKVVERTRTATMLCAASGNPDPEITWFKDFLPVDTTNNNGRIKQLRSGGTPIRGALQIEQSEESDQGKYECVATNGAGTRYSAPANLYVRVRRVPPRFSIPPTNHEIMPGGSVNITCVAVGSPMPYVKWMLGAEDLTPEDDMPIGRNVLELTDVRQSANYTCVAMSTLGVIEAVSQITVKALPKPPGTPVVTESTATSITLTWDSGNPEPVSYYIIQHRSKSEETYKEIDGVATTRYSVGGLSPYSEYEFRVVAVNNIGRGPPSEPVETRTAEQAPSTAPRQVMARMLSSTTILVQWEEPEEANGQIQGYRVYYTMEPSQHVNNWQKHNVGDTHITTISGLTPQKTYHVKVLAFTSVGDGPLSNDIQVITKTGVPAQPTNFKAEAKSETSILLSWVPPKGDSIIGYELVYKKGEQGEEQHVTFEPDTSYLLQGLKPFTNYFFRLAARSSYGQGAATTEISAETPQTQPSAPPQDIKCTSPSSTSILVSWLPPPVELQNGIITKYSIQYAAIEGEDTNPHHISDLFPETSQYLLEELEKWTEYRVTVSAHTEVGPGPESLPQLIRTDEDVPSGPPRKVEVEAVNSTSIKVTWRSPVPNKQHGQIRGYQVHYVKMDNGEPRGQPMIKDIMLADAQVMVISGLQPETTYSVTVTAYTTKGDGARSKPKLVSTTGAVPGRPRLLVSPTQMGTALIQWHPPVETFGPVQGYRLKYGRKDTDLLTILEFSEKEDHFTITDIHKGASYVFCLSARNKVGFGEEIVKEISIPEDVPSGFPQHIVADSPTSTTFQLSWQPPVLSDQNGVIVKYTVLYKDINSPNNPSELIVMPPETTVKINGLKADTTYDIKVRAYTSKGAGPYSPSVQFRTQPLDQAVFAKNFHVKAAMKTSVLLTWEIPENYNPAQPFTILYDNGQSVEVDGKVTQKLITNLQPGTQYSFLLTNRGNSAGGLQHRVSTMTAPDVLRTKPYFIGKTNTDGMLTVELPAVQTTEKVKGYYIVVVPLTKQRGKFIKPWVSPDEMNLEELLKQINRTSGSLRLRRQAEPRSYIAAYFKELPTEFTLGDQKIYGDFENKPLQNGQEYIFFVLAVLEISDNTMYSTSPYSDPVVSADIDPQPIIDEEEGLIWVVGPVLAVVFIICIVIAILLYKRKRAESDSRKSSIPNSKEITSHHPTDPVELRRLNFQTPGSDLSGYPGNLHSSSMASHPPIPIMELADQLERLKANDNLKFSQEYESIDPGQQFTWEHSNLEVNKPKNRYANVIAYDHSRVLLFAIEGIPGSDYVNSNYIDGYRKQNAYIATQGPLPETFGDFWRMIWEQRSANVVMMTKLEERSRVKCDQYWPTRGTETYGLIQVTLLDTVELATYCVRTFALYKNGSSEKREVRQFQFTAWPDHGVPEHPTPFLAFLRRVKACNPPDAGPMVVHCSAGVGRTGCFIVIDAMLERIKHEKTVDIYGHVTLMRAQRNYMVQTEDQYIFIHDALLEAVTCGTTEVPARNLYAYIQKLTQIESGENVTGMELEFKRLANTKAHTSRFISANLPCNKFKNRLVNIMPYESTRVCLQPIRGVEGSDYINGSFIDGYRQQKAYIATQGPLAETTEDFWRMLWEHNSTIVVMLTKLREMGREKCHQYWPAERSARYQYFVVDPMAEYNMPQYILREFKVTDARDGQSRTVRQFQFTDWPEQGVPKSGEGFIDFIGQVHKTKEQFGQDGPISVHCSAGVGRTGVFVTLSIVLERMRYEGVVDIFQTVKMLRTQRPAMVQTEDQYQFCYRAGLEYLGSFDHYAT
ncbi:receptor-type tyrosine-protein phosphatase delta-like isoform X5 [Acipenser ruthenus]|uniref:receptor-type tyrosine-protein phosphatase delta-like isoform X5 n=1 Tax=Acipenser ruthenus TaxID=7906 RepID=UPI002740B144|nr:receptor-type tyrosine-protein phosphatase delta-like isoform X5 [Acipenser ruthenus]